MNKPTPLLLIGAGGHARSVAEAARPVFEPVAYISLEKCDDPVLGPLEWLGDDSAATLREDMKGIEALICAGVSRNGSMTLRRRLIEIHSGRRFATVVSQGAWVSPTAQLGEGCAVLRNAVVNSCTAIGKHCVINTAAIIEHDCRLSDNVFVGPGAVVCGGVTIGDDVFIGAGASLMPGIKVCEGAIIGLGAAVCADITEPGTYAGVPAKRIIES